MWQGSIHRELPSVSRAILIKTHVLFGFVSIASEETGEHVRSLPPAVPLSFVADDTF